VFGRHVKPLVPAAFAVVSTHQPALGTRGVLWPVLHMEGLCPSSGDFNRLLMMMNVTVIALPVLHCALTTFIM
jgi:hypothetical protein